MSTLFEMISERNSSEATAPPPASGKGQTLLEMMQDEMSAPAGPVPHVPADTVDEMWEQGNELAAPALVAGQKELEAGDRAITERLVIPDPAKDRPLPRNLGDVANANRALGVELAAHPGRVEKVESNARLRAVNFLRQTDLIRYADAADMKDLTAAFRYIEGVQQADLSPDEVRTLMQTHAVRVYDAILAGAEARIVEAGPGGISEQMGGDLQLARWLRNEAVDGGTSAINLVASYTRRALHGAEQMPGSEQADSLLAFGWSGRPHTAEELKGEGDPLPVEFEDSPELKQFVKWAGRYQQPDLVGRKLSAQLGRPAGPKLSVPLARLAEAALGVNVEGESRLNELLSKGFLASVGESRARLLGVDPGLNPDQALAQTHPALLHRLLSKKTEMEARVALGGKEPTEERFNKMLLASTKNLKGQLATRFTDPSPVDLRRSAEAAAVRDTSDEMMSIASRVGFGALGALQEIMMGALSMADKVDKAASRFSGALDRAREGTRAFYNDTRPPLEGKALGEVVKDFANGGTDWSTIVRAAYADGAEGSTGLLREKALFFFSAGVPAALEAELGRLARTAPELVTRQVIRDAVERATDAGLDRAIREGMGQLPTPADLKHIEKQTADSLRLNGLFSSETIGNVSWGAWAGLQAGIGERLHLVKDNPAFLAGLLAGGAAVGRATQPALSKMRVPWISRWTRSMRTRDAVASAAYQSPGFAQRLVDAVSNLRGKSISGTSIDRRLAAVEAMAKEVVDHHAPTAMGLDDAVRAERIADLTRTTQKLRNQLARLPGKTVDQFPDLMDVASDIRAAIDTKTGGGFLDSLIRAAGQRTGVRGHQLFDSIARDSKNLAKILDDGLKQGVDPYELSKVTNDLSLDGIRGKSPLRLAAEKALPQPVRRWSKSFDNVAGKFGGVVADLIELTGTYLPIASEWRMREGALRRNQLDLLSYLERRHTIDADAHETNRVLSALEPEDSPSAQRVTEFAQRRAASLGRAERARTLRAELTNRSFDGAVRFSRLKDIVDDLTLEDMEVFFGQMLDSGPNSFVSERLLLDLTGGDADAVAKMRTRWQAATAGKKKGAEKFRRSVAKKFLRAHFDSEGMLGKAYLNAADVDDVAAISSYKMAELRRQRVKAYRKATEVGKKEIDERGLGPSADYGLRTFPLRDGRQKLRDWAVVGQANAVGPKPLRFNELGAASLESVMKTAQRSEQETTLNLVAHQWRVEQLRDHIDALSPEGKKAYRAALREAAEGDPTRMNDFLGSDTAARILSNAGTDEENVRRILRTSDRMYSELLDAAADVGMLPAEMINDLKRAYNPHLFGSHHLNEILPSESALASPAATSLRIAKGGGVSLAEFMSQRSLSKWRVARRTPDGATKIRAFNTEAEAREWLTGPEGPGFTRKRRLAVGEEGLSDLGDRIHLLSPLQQSDLDMGLLDAEVATVARLNTFAKDVTMWQFLKRFDNPRWSMTKKEFDTRIRRGLIEATDQNKFVTLPKGREFGPLRGKVVPRQVMDQINHYTEGVDAMRGIAKALSETSWGGTRLGSASALSTHFLTSSALWLNSRVSAAITRAADTMGVNWLMDREVFARLADPTNGGYFHSAAGQESQRLAMKFMFGESTYPGISKRVVQRWLGKDGIDDEVRRLFDDMTPEEQRLFREVQEEGIIDETVIGSNGLNPAERRWQVEQLFGKKGKSVTVEDAKGTPLGELMEAQGIARATEQQIRIRKRLGELEGLLKDESHPQYRALFREKATLEAALKTISKDDLPGKMRAFGRFIHRVAGDQSNRGLGGTIQSGSRDVYARIGNLNRVGMYTYLRKQGWSIQDARTHVNRFMQNYRGVPRAMRKLSRSPVGSTITSFPYEMLRITKNWLRYQPARYAGLMSAVPAINMMTMLAGNVDPHVVMGAMSQQSGGLPPWLAFTHTLVLPTGGGEFGLASVPGLELAQAGSRSFGIVGTSLDRETFPEGFTGDVASMGANALAKFVTSSPVASVVSSLMGRDPMSGNAYRTRSDGWWGAAKTVASVALPPQAPGFGLRMFEYTTSAPTVTGRTVTNIEQVAQLGFGVRLRGGVVENMIRKVGGRDAMKAVDKAVGVITTGFMGGAGRDAALNRLDPKAFGRDELLGALLWKYRARRPNAGRVDVVADRHYRLMVLGAAMQKEGNVEAGKSIFEQGRKGFEEARASAEELAQLAKEGRSSTRLFNAIGKALKHSDPMGRFESASPDEHAFVLVEAAKSRRAFPDAYFNRLVRVALLGERAQLRAGGNVDDLTRAAGILARGLEDTTIAPERAQLLTSVARAIRRRQQMARVDAHIKNVTDQDRRATLKFLEEQNQ